MLSIQQWLFFSSSCTQLPKRASESSESDSLLQSSSSESDSTPVGTPTANKKKEPGFSREALIAKYGEEIFSSSRDSPDDEEEEEENKPPKEQQQQQQQQQKPKKIPPPVPPKPRGDSPMVKSKFGGGKLTSFLFFVIYALFSNLC